ncbi:ABC transporter ATP-binding protein [Phytohabitans aurantiacus]|jgi:putative ABC transport system ATP-binding protein|uniref:Macrolide ABC transporter ATP-binding protein n=1 Tax=Phytohabitans aurantiacus TaxID=3016789 RepID=A0ABQ5QPI3_9ACTN|nr:ABC transporter ATP-binding protein [Phytohabitans aurantiacus]GLH96170.1 macrolide ABC transporter ATP-binding protein [Phytohabitans aurantiacus]
MSAVLSFYGVTREYRSGETTVRALDGLTLEVEAGELVAIMGPSGSGKSTLLAIGGGLDTPTSGEVRVEGTALDGLSPAALARLRRDHIGYVFQDFNLVSGLTAAENVALPRELAGVSARAARAEAVAALAEVGLDGTADRFPDQLSGGQQQRVAVARAMIGQRRLLLADEPTGALDSVTGQAVLDLIRSRVDAGAAGVLVTHEARFASWADRIVFLRDGRLVDSTGGRDRVEELLSS